MDRLAHHRAPLRKDYERFVELANEGARELGFADLGAMWRSGYDMPPDEFEKETERLWGQVKPLYDELHCYVRAQAQQEVRRQGRAEDRPDPRAPARQHVGAGVGQHLPAASSRTRAQAALDVTPALEARSTTR